MSTARFFHRSTVVAFLTVALTAVVGSLAVHAQETAVQLSASQTVAARAGVWHYFGSAIGLGLIVIGAALGIGKFAAAAAEGIARQPGAADKITGAVNLPLFLLEGVAVIAEIGILLIVLIK